MDETEVESVLKLHLHRNIHFRDFSTLTHKVKEFFFVLTHKFCLNYFPDYPEYEILCLGQIELLRSGYIRQHVAKIVEKGEPKALRELFRDRWFSLLSKSDFFSLMNDSEHGLYEILLEVNKDLDEEACNIELPSLFQKLSNQNLVVKIKKTIRKKDKKLIIVLFRLNFFKKLNLSDVIEIAKDHDFVEILYELREEHYSDSIVGKGIYTFFEENESLLKTPVKQMIVDRLMMADYEKIFTAWRFGWFLYLSKNDLCNILERRELHFLENLLLSLHYCGYEKGCREILGRKVCFSTFERNARYLFPFSDDFPPVDSKVGDALRPHIVEVIGNGKKQSLIPLVALGYINMLDPKKIVSFFEDTELKLFTKLYLAYRHNSGAFSYYNPDFYTWKDTFNVFLESLDLEKVFYSNEDEDYYTY